VRDRITDLKLKANFSLLGVADDDAIVLSEQGGEPVVLTPLEATRLRESDVVICASSAETARTARQMAGGESAPPFVDLTHGLEGLPHARLRSPLTEPAGHQPEPTSVSVVAHPAATALALLLLPVQRAFPIRQAVANVLEPASERGQAGISELQQQVMSLLSFRPLERKIFDAQLAFNLLGKYGEDAPEKLEDTEARIERHLASVLAAAAPMPSLRMIQAPVFHGYTISLWLELETRPEMEDLEAELESAHVEVRGSDVEAPSNVSSAGQSGVSVGLIAPDRNHPRGIWMWAALDNYRMQADNAVAVARGLLGGGQS
jgi:aspartate-semialdehyde dehydrogenase